ncbi:unnamed protein product [Onchocerca flexuosa]|uniref:Transposase n=1 Tax=Onchocerca flexuosa TaxID=387005 RepID=A0A183HM91_9BILA|nr:unnamed protein product [Onchocerca flexuosa]
MALYGHYKLIYITPKSKSMDRRNFLRRVNYLVYNHLRIINKETKRVNKKENKSKAKI